MIEIKLIEIGGFVSALQALHLPFGKECSSNVHSGFWTMNKEDKVETTYGNWNVSISSHDENLIKALIKNGDEHAKVVRGIVAYLEINAPRYWWVEMDTYRMGREQLASESTMHIQGKGMDEETLVYMKSHLTEGTMQKRIIMLSYQTLRRIYIQRHNHRLPQWREFCDWILNNLPYSWMIYEKEDE